MYADLVFLGGAAFVAGAPRPVDVAVRRGGLLEATGLSPADFRRLREEMVKLRENLSKAAR